MGDLILGIILWCVVSASLAISVASPGYAMCSFKCQCQFPWKFATTTGLYIVKTEVIRYTNWFATWNVICITSSMDGVPWKHILSQFVL